MKYDRLIEEMFRHEEIGALLGPQGSAVRVELDGEVDFML